MDKLLFEVRNEDNQIVSQHATNDEAQKAARVYRNDRAFGAQCYKVFGPVAETNRA